MTEHTDSPELPIPTRQPSHDRRIQALLKAHQAGWLEYQATWGTGADRRYAVVVDGRRRDLLPDEVLPYVLGVADKLGVGDQVAYREGLL